MTVSKTVFIGAVAFVPAAILHGCGGDDKNKAADAKAQTGVRPAGGDNGGSEDQNMMSKVVKFRQKVQDKVTENLDNMVELKQLVKDKNYSGAWTKLTTDFPEMAKKLVKENFSKGEGKTAENLTTDDQNKCVQKLHDDWFEAPEPLASTAGASSKDTSAPEGGDDSQELEEDRNDALKLQLVEAIDATNYAEATVVLDELDMTEEQLQEQSPELFEKLQAIKPEQDDAAIKTKDAAFKALAEAIDAGDYDQAMEVLDTLDMTEEQFQEQKPDLFEKLQAIKPAEDDEQSGVKHAVADQVDAAPEDISETYDTLLKEFAAEKKKSVEKLTDDELEEFADILEEHDMDFKEHVNGLEDNEQTKKIAATLKEIAQTEGEDSYHKIVNRIQKKYLADKDEEDLTDKDYAAIVQELEDHQIDFQKHIKERSQTDPLAKADKTRKFNDIMDGKDLKKSEDREQFVQELDDHSQDFEEHLQVAAEKNTDKEIDMAGLLTDLQNKKAQKVVIAMEELVALEDGEDAVEEVLQGLTGKLYKSSSKHNAKDITAEDLSTFFGELEQDVTDELERLIKEGTPEQQEKATLILEALKAEDGGASGSGAESDQGRKRNAPGSAGETQQDAKRARHAQSRHATMAPTGQ